MLFRSEIVKRFIDSGRAWVKVSGPYLDSHAGPPGYSDIGAIARALVHYAPDRCVWGSDWPHPTQREDKPDDAAMLDLIIDWTANEETRRKILVENPAKLYGF